MKITLTSVFVDEQEKALKFYTEILGFVKKQDVPLGEFRWITVVSPEEEEGVQLVLEPDNNPAAKTFKQSIFNQNIPITAFEVSDINAEYERLKNLGVKFTKEPTVAGPVTIAVFDDTCGNLVQIYQA